MIKVWKGKPSIELTNWQTHQWERACRIARAEGKKPPKREGFRTLTRGVVTALG